MDSRLDEFTEFIITLPRVSRRLPTRAANNANRHLDIPLQAATESERAEAGRDHRPDCRHAERKPPPCSGRRGGGRGYGAYDTSARLRDRATSTPARRQKKLQVRALTVGDRHVVRREIDMVAGGTRK